jgi:glycosyltransferase involved in cell wall biosynthesis
VACSNVTSLPEVAGDAAIFFDPRNAGEIAAAIRQINDDSLLLDTLANKGRQQAAALGNEQQMAQKYWHVFVQTAARHKGNS